MKLKVLGSSSAGNCYVLENEQEALILECGVKFKEVKKALGFNLRKVTGALLTHSHGDHAAYVNDFLTSGITVYACSETIAATGIASHRWRSIEKKSIQYHIGTWQVIPFPVKHDVPCLGFLLRHDECGTICFITDTYYLPFTFRGLNNIIVEANYAEDILQRRLEAGRIHGKVRDRVIASHMELETTKDFLKANDLAAVNNIVLIHLSDSNSDADRFRREVIEVTGKRVYVAERGLEIEFNKTLL